MKTKKYSFSGTAPDVARIFGETGAESVIVSSQNSPRCALFVRGAVYSDYARAAARLELTVPIGKIVWVVDWSNGTPSWRPQIDSDFGSHYGAIGDGDMLRKLEAEMLRVPVTRCTVEVLR